MKNNYFNAIQDGGVRNLVSAFIDGETIGPDDKDARGVQNLDETIAMLTLNHELSFTWETDQVEAVDGYDASDFRNTRYSLNPESASRAKAALGLW